MRCSHGQECTLPWAAHDWSYEARYTERLKNRCYACQNSRVPCDGPMSHPVINVKCCRVWPVVLGFPIGTCGLCSDYPRRYYDE